MKSPTISFATRQISATDERMNMLPQSFATDARGVEPLFLVLGPCAFESKEHCISIAEFVSRIGRRLGCLVIFKVSFDKANRTSRNSYRGRGMNEALLAFDEIRRLFALPVLTDVHEPWQCAAVAPHVDVIQIPAMLSRQTDLLKASGATRLPVNIKKGQFLSPAAMRWAADKVRTAGGRPMACERGTFFGYGELINDFRSLRIMRNAGMPVLFDATHSLQTPGGVDGRSGGDRSAVLDLARAAVAVGIDGLFIETHEDPDRAPSDGATMVPLAALEEILAECVALDNFVKRQLCSRQ